MREKLERHILEGQGRPVKELQNPGVFIQRLQRRDRGIVKTIPAIGGGDGRLDFRRREILQKQPENL